MSSTKEEHFALLRQTLHALNNSAPCCSMIALDNFLYQICNVSRGNDLVSMLKLPHNVAHNHRHRVRIRQAQRRRGTRKGFDLPSPPGSNSLNRHSERLGTCIVGPHAENSPFRKDDLGSRNNSRRWRRRRSEASPLLAPPQHAGAEQVAPPADFVLVGTGRGHSDGQDRAPARPCSSGAGIPASPLEGSHDVVHPDGHFLVRPPFEGAVGAAGGLLGREQVVLVLLVTAVVRVGAAPPPAPGVGLGVVQGHVPEEHVECVGSEEEGLGRVVGERCFVAAASRTIPDLERRGAAFEVTAPPTETAVVRGQPPRRVGCFGDGSHRVADEDNLQWGPSQRLQRCRSLRHHGAVLLDSSGLFTVRRRQFLLRGRLEGR
mmetsp:Transcript_8550/g.15653  ORF Transcript_8550/g.15653 Transcript_8550/m.15653 type:complete len:375 (-) Transcript_8550:1409-2533(-)